MRCPTGTDDGFGDGIYSGLVPATQLVAMGILVNRGGNRDNSDRLPDGSGQGGVRGIWPPRQSHPGIPPPLYSPLAIVPTSCHSRLRLQPFDIG